MNKVTRRSLFAASVPLAALAVQEPAGPPTSRDEDLKSARETVANNSALLAKVDLPMAIEPAFVFKA